MPRPMTAGRGAGGRSAGRGAPSKGVRGGRQTKQRRPRFREQSKCRFCRDKIKEIDYKDIGSLQKLTTQHGKMFSRKRSGNCALHQRSARRAIKRARYIGLIPYVS
jgi:small subunit ribosomal protein S18